MCDPLTIAGIALTGASTVANSIGAAKANKAREGAMAAERIRQQGYDRETDALNAQSQNRYQDFEGQQDDRAAELTDYFKAQASPLDTVNASAALPPSSSNITVVEEGRQRQKARDFTNTQAASLGQLRSFGDLVGSIGRDQARDAMKIGQIGGFKRGSASIIPHELEAAASKGSGYRFLGDVLGGAGGVALYAARNPDVLANTIPGSIEIKFGADPWRGMRTTGDKSFLKAVRLGPTMGSQAPSAEQRTSSSPALRTYPSWRPAGPRRNYLRPQRTDLVSKRRADALSRLSCGSVCASGDAEAFEHRQGRVGEGGGAGVQLG